MESSSSIFSVKNIVIFVVLVLMIIAIPVAVELAKRQTQLKSQAAGDGNMTFTGNNVKQEGNQFVTTSKELEVTVTSPFGAAPQQ